MGVNIRYANKDDAQAFGLIYSQSYQAAFRGIIPDKILNDVFSPEKRSEGLLRELSTGSHISAILFKDDIAAGILTYGSSKDIDLNNSYIEILRIYIQPSYWGQNLGAELMAWGLDKLQQQGCAKVTLWVIEENMRARKFYEKLGFVQDGVTRTINVGKDIKDLRYIKSL
jgi:ribosomal protein S18 acetylase RimI-like enzyme